MKSYICERVLEEADYVLEQRCTVREVAKQFCVSKSTAHKDLSERLPIIDKELYKRVAEVMTDNWSERYLRGGQATKKKYKGCYQLLSACSQNATKGGTVSFVPLSKRT